MKQQFVPSATDVEPSALASAMLADICSSAVGGSSSSSSNGGGGGGGGGGGRGSALFGMNQELTKELTKELGKELGRESSGGQYLPAWMLKDESAEGDSRTKGASDSVQRLAYADVC
jgi:hypothetical protein